MFSIKKIFIISVSILFVITSVVGIFSVAAERTLFDVERYKEAFLTSDIYSQIPAWMAELITKNNGSFMSPITDVMKETITQDDWESIFILILPQDWAQQQTDLMLDDVFGYLSGENKSLTVGIDLIEVKKSIRSESTSISGMILNKWPICDANQLAKLLQDLLSGTFSLDLFCLPPDPYRQLFEEFFTSSILMAENLIPDQTTISLIDENGVAVIENLRVQQALILYRLVRSILLLTPLFALAFVPILILLTYRNANLITQYFGWSFLTIGGIGVVIGFVLIPLSNYLSSKVFDPFSEVLPISMVNAFSNASASIYRQLALTGTWISFVILVMGLTLLLVRAILNRSR